MKTIKHSPTLTEYIYDGSDADGTDSSKNIVNHDEHEDSKGVQIAEIIGVVEEDE